MKSIRSFEVAIQVSMAEKTEDGRSLITQRCVTEKEVNREIDRLIKSLNGLRRNAKAKLGAK